MREIRMSGSVGRGLRPPYPIRLEPQVSAMALNFVLHILKQCAA